MNRTFVHDTPFALEGARLESLEPCDFRLGLVRLKAGRRKGRLVSPPIGALFEFDRLVLSVNAVMPAGASLAAEVRVSKGREWGEWHAIGVFDSRGGSSAPSSPASEERDRVDVDTLILEEPADGFQYRLSLERSRGPGPAVKLAAAAYSHPVSLPRSLDRNGWRSLVRLDVPARSQMTEPEPLRRRVCSPTALGMVLEYWGGPRTPTPAIAAAVRDRHAEIYGNWFLNTAWAGRRLDAWVAMLSGYSELERELAFGRPVVCTIAFEKGNLPGAPLERTDGHLVVVRGFDAAGDVLVNDPAAPSPREAERVYPREPFGRAWLERKRGVAYRIAPRFPKELRVAWPSADLRSEPVARRGRRDPRQESQLLLGERVRCLGALGEWASVEALDQTRGGRPFKGWAPAAALARLEEPADRVVVRKWAPARLGARRSMRLPAGALVKDLGPAGGGMRHVLLPGDVQALVPALALHGLEALPEKGARKRILEVASSFLGERYLWGGMTSEALGSGVDCSGLVAVAYRAAGMRVPRNAHDQWAESEQIERPEPGDLAFLSKPGEPNQITHVMIWLGEGRVLEAEGAADRVREARLESKLGVPGRAVRPGSEYGGRRLTYGTFFGASPDFGGR